MGPRVSDGSLAGDPWYQRISHALGGLGVAKTHMLDTATFGLTKKLRDWQGGGRSKTEDAINEIQHPNAAKFGNVAGLVASALPAGGVSAGLGRAVPALGRMTTPSIMANQAATGATLSGIGSVADAATSDKPVNWSDEAAKAGVSAALGGVGGGLLHSVGKWISPSVRVRSAGASLEPGDATAMRGLSKRAGELGVKLTVPELATAVAPGRSGRLETLYSAGKRSDAGRRAAFDFHAARMPAAANAVEDVASGISQGATPPGLNASLAASKAIGDAKGLVRASAQPYYDAADAATVQNVPQTSAVQDAAKSVLKNKRKMEALGNAPADSVAFLGAVRKRMDAKATTLVKKDPHLSSLIRGDADRLNAAMDAASPHHKTARDIFHQGQSQLVEPLEAGPLGTISKTTDPTKQANALFKVKTPAMRDASVNAAARLPEDINRGLVAHRLRSVADNDPLAVGNKFMPTPHSEAVVSSILKGDDLQRLRSLTDVLGAVNRGTAVPSVEQGLPAHALHFMPGYDAARQVGRAAQSHIRSRALDRLHDPKTIDILGKMGLVQRGALGVSTGGAVGAGRAVGPAAWQAMSGAVPTLYDLLNAIATTHNKHDWRQPAR
jgi:hypothetical protein